MSPKSPRLSKLQSSSPKTATFGAGSTPKRENTFVIVDINLNNTADLATSNGLPPMLCESLLLETLLFARQAAREDLNVAKVMFGMTAPAASQIASLTMRQTRSIALANTQHFRVRWDNKPDFWRKLLIASRDADERALEALRHHAKRLFFGEILRRRSRKV